MNRLLNLRGCFPLVIPLVLLVLFATSIPLSASSILSAGTPLIQQKKLESRLKSTKPIQRTLTSESVAKFEQARKDYKDKKYAEALRLLNQLHNTHQCNETVHYFMALCYQASNQIAAANQQYMLVARSQNIYLRYYARKALVTLNKWNAHRLYKGNGNIFQESRPPTSFHHSGGG